VFPDEYWDIRYLEISHDCLLPNPSIYTIFFFFFLYGAAAHIGPWPPLYEVP
jgi:hypothetical protein